MERLLLGPSALGVPAMQINSGPGVGAFDDSQRAQASQAGALASGAAVAAARVLRRRDGDQDGGPRVVQRGTAFTSKSVANDGRGGTAREDRDSSEGSTAALQEIGCGSAHGSKQGIARRLRGGDGEAVVVEAAGGTQKYGEVEKAGGAGGDAFAAAHAFSASSEDKAARHAACRKCRGNLLASLRLRGGCGNEEEAQGLDFGATQSFDFDDEEEGEPQQRRLLWLKDGATVGAAAELPSMDGKLALGRVVQPTPRAGSGDVETLELADADWAAAPLVSGLQAEIHVDDDGHMILTSKGKSYNFINGNPLHVSGSQAAAAGVPSQARLYDGDDIRLGGDLDGRKRGGYDKFCFRVERHRVEVAGLVCAG